MAGKLPESVRTRPKAPLAASPVAPTAQWSAARASGLFTSTRAVERFIDIRRFRESVHGESLLASESHAAWAAISLAMWLRCDATNRASIGTI